jgi:hypothetical protein
VQVMWDQAFIDRFWVAYWQGRELVRQAFPPDGEYTGQEGPTLNDYWQLRNLSQ